MDQTQLFETYGLSDHQLQFFRSVKKAKNMPDFFETLSDEEIIWAIAVSTADIPENPSEKDLQFYDKKVEERVRKLSEAETRYNWFSLKWDEHYMKKLINNWFCGMLVIDPDLKTSTGSPIQFVHEYYGPESKYPDTDNQTDKWKKEVIDLYVLMTRSICKSYPNATSKGIVSFSDMKDFDWNKYDMETKTRNAEITSVIPNRLARMITIRPEEKMNNFYKEMTPRLRKKYGFVQYDDYNSAKLGEKGLLPEDLPTFVGGNYRVDVLKCLKYLFRREDDVLQLMLDTYEEMEKKGEIPRPKHMQ